MYVCELLFLVRACPAPVWRAVGALLPNPAQRYLFLSEKKKRLTAPRCDALRSALRGPMQCAAMSCAAPCFSRGTCLGEVPGQAREKPLSASCACFRFLGEIPQAQPSIPFNPFWWSSPTFLEEWSKHPLLSFLPFGKSGPSILFVRFFLSNKTVQASSPLVSSF